MTPESSPPASPSASPPAVEPTAECADQSPPHPAPAPRLSIAVASPANTSAALWRQNTDLQRRNQELELEVHNLRGVSARRRLSSISINLSSVGSALGSRRTSWQAAPEEDAAAAASSGAAGPIAAALAAGPVAAAWWAELEAQLADAKRRAAVAERELTVVRGQTAAAREAAEAALSAALAEADAARAAAAEDVGAARSAAELELAAAKADAEARIAEEHAAAEAELAAVRDVMQHSAAAAEAELASVRAEAAMAEAGLERLMEQLADAQRGAEQLRTQLVAAQQGAQQVQEQLEATQESLAAKEAQASQLAEQLQAAQQEARRWQEEAGLLASQLADAVHALEDARSAAQGGAMARMDSAESAHVPSEDRSVTVPLQKRAGSEGHGGTKLAISGEVSSGQSPVRPRPRAQSSAARSTSPASPRVSSRAEYSRSPRSTHHYTHVVNQIEVLPSPPEGGSTRSESESVAAVMQELETEVTNLRERLRVAEAELARQLAGKQAAQLELTTVKAEVVALKSERELLQEQAVYLQQEVSSLQCSTSEGPGGEDGMMGMMGMIHLERSPSRTLTTRMRELLSPRRSRSSSMHSLQSFQPLSEGASGGRSRNGSVSASPVASPRQMAVLPEEASMQLEVGPLQEGERMRSLQQQIATLEHRLSSKETQLAEQAAGAAAALAAARQEYEGLKEQAVAAETAAEAVLQLHRSGVGVGTKPTSAHKECRAAIEGIYAQMWRERLGRQKAQVQATELRQRLSEHQANSFAGSSGGGGSSGSKGGSLAGSTADEMDEALMQSLEAEMARSDHLQDELKRYKAQQLKLQERAEQLEMQLAEYNTLLAEAEGLNRMPCLRGGPSSPGGRKSPGSRNSPRSRGSPVQAAITALQGRRAMEEAEALREQLKATKADMANLRRRERDSLAALKAARAGQRELEHKQAVLTAGLDTLQRLLAKRAGQLSSRRSSTATRSPKGPSKDGSPPGDNALAVLSALLKTLQTEEVGDGQAVVSPQQSEYASRGGSITAGVGAGEALGLVSPQDGAVAEQEALSDPLDISALLPLADGDAAGGAQPAAPGGSRSASQTCEPEADSFTIPASHLKSAVLLETDGTPAAAAAPPARSLSRIPAPPPQLAGAQKSTASPRGTPRGRLSGIAGYNPRSLSKLLGPCRRPGPHATLSSASEAGHPA